MYHTFWTYEYTDFVLLAEISLNGVDFSVVFLWNMFIHKYFVETSKILSFQIIACVQSELTFQI